MHLLQVGSPTRFPALGLQEESGLKGHPKNRRGGEAPARVGSQCGDPR